MNALRVVTEVKNSLDERGVACVFGAPGTGKTELLAQALEGRPSFIWDQRSQFLTTTKTPKGRYKQVETKQAETVFLTDQLFQDIARRVESIQPRPVVIFDEFDLGISDKLNNAEAATASKLIDFGACLKAKGFPVVFILHDEGLQCPLILERLHELGIHSTAIIKTGFFEKAEQDLMLSHGGNLSDRSLKTFKVQTRGLPGAFVPLLKCPAGQRLSSDALNKQAIATLEKCIRVFFLKAPQALKDLVARIALGAISIDKKFVTGLERTGFIRIHNGMASMPILAQRAYLRATGRQV